jgi:tetratricopeptide (TPR) repeat protein
MMATSNSNRLPPGALPRLLSLLHGFLLASTMSLGAEDLWNAGLDEAAKASYREHATRQYHEARTAHRAEPDNVALAWQFGRAAFDLAEVAYNKQERETLAREGIDACRAAIALEPDLAVAHYYLGMNLGQLARVYMLRGLRIISEMEQAFLKARALDPRVDHGGADRNLGLLYHRAPGWPISMGNKPKGRQHLERAVKLSPDYPGNRLYLAEALWDTKHHEGFLDQVHALKTLIPKARKSFDPEEWRWAWAWADWNPRWQRLQALAQTLPSPD